MARQNRQEAQAGQMGCLKNSTCSTSSTSDSWKHSAQEWPKLGSRTRATLRYRLVKLVCFKEMLKPVPLPTHLPHLLPHMVPIWYCLPVIIFWPRISLVLGCVWAYVCVQRHQEADSGPPFCAQLSHHSNFCSPYSSQVIVIILTLAQRLTDG